LTQVVYKMSSSYNNATDYKDLFETITFVCNPKKVVEFGILNGVSLKCIADTCDTECHIYAYDIFDEFVGNHACKDDIVGEFNQYKNVLIDYGDFYKKHTEIEDSSIELLHIDIANDANVYEFAIDNYLSKLSQDGCMVLEGGSCKRDEVYWMVKYNKKTISPYLEQLQQTRKDIRIKTIGDFPSITIIKKVY
jgi:predicted O-methyltransferase YrrM